MINEIAISKIKIGRRFRKNYGEITTLMESIKEIGLLHPVVINEKNRLVAGKRRILAFKLLGKKVIPCTKINLKKIILGEFDENEKRKALTPSETIEILEAVSKTRIGHRPKKGAKLALFPKGKTTKIVARYSGFSESTIKKIQAIKKAADTKPKEFGDLLTRIDKKQGGQGVDNAYSELKRREAATRPVPEFPTNETEIIVIDPGWEYGLKLRGSVTYRTMSYEELSKLKIPATKDSVIFLWTTTAKLNEGMQLLKDWIFEYKSSIIWVKQKNGELQTGNGHYCRSAHEFLLIGTRGNPGTPSEKVRPDSVIFAPREEHSQKPDVFFEIIDKMYPGKTKGEIFARKKREGWIQFGDELK